MKKILTLILLISLKCFPNYYPGTITFKDKTTMSGLIELKGDEKVSFKSDKKAKKEIFLSSIIELIIVERDGIKAKYIFALTISKGYVQNHERVRCLEIMKEGKVNMYYYGVSMQNFSTATYYIKRINEEKPVFFTCIGYLKTQDFSEFSRQYFNDCPILVEKIENKELKEKQFEEIIDYYNSQCH